MKKLGIISAMLLIVVGCMGFIAIKTCPSSSVTVKAASRLIADMVVLGMEDVYIDVFGRATGDGDFAEVIQQFDPAVTPESNYDLVNKELHKHLYDVYGTMLKWSVEGVGGIYEHYALVDFNADTGWDFALKAKTTSPEQDVFFYCLPEDANPTRDVRAMVSDAEKPNDRSIASIVGIVTVDGEDIFLASKVAEFDFTLIHVAQDARHFIEASLGAA